MEMLEKSFEGKIDQSTEAITKMYDIMQSRVAVVEQEAEAEQAIDGITEALAKFQQSQQLLHMGSNRRTS